jgi:opacity protein-like surface antigen
VQPRSKVNALTSRVTALAVLSLCGVIPAYSQDYYGSRPPVGWQASGGYSATTGTTSNYLDGGWIFSGGAVFRPEPDSPLSLLAELHYSGYGATSKAISVANGISPTSRIDNGDAYIFGVNFDGMYYLPFFPRVHAYLLAGFGWDHRRVRLTQTVLIGGTYCDPWWGYCYSGVVPGEAIVADETTTRFAWNAGFGVEFPVSRGAVYVEARYHQMDTQTPTTFIPIQVGYRF